MRIISNLDDFQNVDSKLVVAFGNFDGIHYGHKKLLQTLIEKAREINGLAAVFTFSNHPIQVLRPEENIKLLLPKEEKEAMLAELGVDLLFLVPFNTTFSKIKPQNFVKDIIVDTLRASGVVVGYNFNFGYQGQGDAAFLEEAGSEMGFFVEVMSPIYCNGQRVSSTLIRHLLSEGSVEMANSFLGYYPFLKGKVVTGDQRGREIGFPTANLDLPETILVPSRGVYVVKVTFDGKVFEGVANIGYRPTFKSDRVSNVEIHLFNGFTRDIYGKILKVEFIHYIRSEQTFSNVEQLKERIQLDIMQAKEYLAKKQAI